MKLSIIVPAYNEENTIHKILSDLVSMPLPHGVEKEIIVVNDCSTDRTANILNSFEDQIVALHNEENLGKTGSVKRGIAASTGDFVVSQDADDEYSPYDLIKMVQMMIADPTIDAVYGNRFHRRNRNKGINYAGNIALTMFSNFMTVTRGVYVHDMETCYKMIKGNLFREIAETFESDRFGLEPETTAKLAAQRAKVVNTDIHYYPRTKKEGKKMNAFRDGWAAVRQIIKFNLSSSGIVGVLRQFINPTQA